nr:hypothetical protein [Marseillevirus cajuinensis]
MSVDFDSVGYWLKGVPYVWIPSENIKDCKRYYFLNGNTGAYDSENRSSEQGHWTRFVVSSSDRLLDISLYVLPCKDSWVKNYFSVFPFDTRTWRISNKGEFLVSPPLGRGSWIPEREWEETQKGFELRVDGKRADVVPGVPDKRNFADLLLASGRILTKVVTFVPGKYSSSLSYPPFGFSLDDAAVRSKTTGKKFMTIASLADHLDLPIKERKLLHERCLDKEFEYNYLFLDEKDLDKKEEMKIAAEWFNKIWSGEIRWGGPPSSDVELFEHPPYEDNRPF